MDVHSIHPVGTDPIYTHARLYVYSYMQVCQQILQGKRRRLLPTSVTKNYFVKPSFYLSLTISSIYRFFAISNGTDSPSGSWVSKDVSRENMSYRQRKLKFSTVEDEIHRRRYLQDVNAGANKEGYLKKNS